MAGRQGKWSNRFFVAAWQGEWVRNKLEGQVRRRRRLMELGMLIGGKMVLDGWW